MKNMKNIIYLILIGSGIGGAIAYIQKGDELSAGFFLLVALISLSVYDILSELKKSNEGVIVRDPKTGRFVRK